MSAPSNTIDAEVNLTMNLDRRQLLAGTAAGLAAGVTLRRARGEEVVRVGWIRQTTGPARRNRSRHSRWGGSRTSCKPSTPSAEVGDGEKYPTNFQLCFNTAQEADTVGHYLIDKLGVKKVGILQENTAFGEKATTATKAVLDKAGLKPTDIQVYPLTAPDLNPYIANLRKSGAEGIVMWTANTPQAAAVFNALDSQQWFRRSAARTACCRSRC